MATSTVPRSYEVPLPAHEDPDASAEPQHPTPKYTMTSASFYEIPTPAYEELEPTTISSPPTSDFMTTSSDSSSYETPEPIYEDLDALVTADTVGSQSNNKLKPEPRPRFKIKPTAESNNNTSDSVDQQTNNTTSEMSSSYSEYPTDYKRVQPVRPPPRPPVCNTLTSSKPTPSPEGANQYMSSNSQPSVKPPAVSGEKQDHRRRRECPPPPPSFYYDRPGSAVDTKSKSCTEEQSSPSSFSTEQSPFSPALPEVAPLSGNYREMTAGGKDKPAVPPRPRHTLPPTYDSVCESPPAQIRRPPPPVFTPPPPPSTQIPSESLYSEIDCPYLEVLPQEDNKRIRPPPRPGNPPSPRPTRTLSAESPTEPRPYLDILPQEDSKMIRPPPRPANPPSPRPTRTLSAESPTEPRPYLDILPDKDKTDIDLMLRWLKIVSKPDYMVLSVYGLSIEEEISLFNQRATNVSKALQLYHALMTKHNKSLQSFIEEFISISDSIDKMQKKTKTMGIAGGTTGAVGGVTAMVGLALAPVTLGASLIATAVGAGMVASAGGIGVHTAKAKKNTVDRATVEKLVNDYMANVADLDHCLDFILSEMNELRRHDVARLQRRGAQSEAVKMAHLAQSVFRTNANSNTGRSSERLLVAFSDEMHQYFTVKDGQKLRQLNKSKFSGRIRLLAKHLHDELEHLNCMWEMFT